MKGLFAAVIGLTALAIGITDGLAGQQHHIVTPTHSCRCEEL